MYVSQRVKEVTKKITAPRPFAKDYCQCKNHHRRTSAGRNMFWGSQSVQLVGGNGELRRV